MKSLGVTGTGSMTLFWVLLAIVSFAYILAQGIKGPIGRLLKVIGSFYFAILQYAILFLPVLDLGLWCLSLAGFTVSEHVTWIGTIVLIVFALHCY